MTEPLQTPDQLSSAPQRRWGYLQWLVVGIVVIIAGAVIIPAYNDTAPKARLMWTASYGRQIIVTLKGYASDHGGKYPEGVTSNDAFRELFKTGWLENEHVFGGICSPYQPDHNIGMAPDFKEALKPGENHWAMTKGLTDASSGNAPLVFENPAIASWPPYWNAKAAGQAQPGRTWKSGRIVIARNDGSVNSEPLTSSPDGRVTLQPGSNGKNLFEEAGPHEIMDVAR